MKRIFATLIVTFSLFTFCQSQTRTRIPLVPLSGFYPVYILGLESEASLQQSSIFDVNPTTGAVTNSRTPRYSGSQMPFIGFGYDENGILYGLSASYMQYYSSRLFTIGPKPSFGSLGVESETRINNILWQCGVEGDLAFDKASNQFYALCSNGGWKLVAINRLNGAVTVKGSISGNGPYTALAFHPQLGAYVLDTNARKLLKVDKNNGAILSTITLTGALPNTSNKGGMGFSEGGVLYAAFGGKLLTIDYFSGAIGIIGSTRHFSGLIVTGGAPRLSRR